MYINDGDDTIIRNVKEGLKKYTDSCSRIMVGNPRGLAKLGLPSIANLRKIARRTHFVSRDGLLICLPKAIADNDRSTKVVSNQANKDTDDKDANERLRVFLESRGLTTA